MAAALLVICPSVAVSQHIPKRPMVPPVLVKIPIAPRLCLQCQHYSSEATLGQSSLLEHGAGGKRGRDLHCSCCRTRADYLTVTHLSRAFWTALTRRPTPADSTVTRMAVWMVSWGWKVCASLAEGM